jgi:transposase
MRFYTGQHKYYCGIDLHARTMYVCILNQKGKVLVHKNIETSPVAFLQIIKPYRRDVCVSVECIFCWYWLADVCAEKGIPFVLGHALYMKAVHGGKSKSDKIDSLKIASMLRGGMLPVAYTYPRKMRATRDLLRRRMHLMRKRSELLVHIQLTKHQYNLPSFQKIVAKKSERSGISKSFPDPIVRKNIEVDLSLLDFYDKILPALEFNILKIAREHDSHSLFLLQSIPGVGKILGLVMLYEIHDIARFPTVQNFSSYSRLVKCARESAGKLSGVKNSKIGNAHLKWAFSEAACLFLKDNQKGQKYHERLVRRHGKGKALGIIAHRLGRAAYFILKNKEPFSMNKFFTE